MGDGAAIAAVLASADRELAALGKPVAGWFDEMLAADRIRAGCIEASASGGPWVVGAVGLSTFLGDDVVEPYLAAPITHFAAHLVARGLAGERSIFLGDAETGVASAGAGLNLFILGFGYLYPPESPHVTPLLSKAIEHFVSAHAGFRLKRLLREDPAPIAEMFLRSGMRAIATFPPVDPTSIGRVVTMLDRDDIHPLFPFSPATTLFQFSPPRIGFARAERRLLTAAMEGHPDHELAEQLDISLNTIKRTWRMIFERALREAPYVLGPSAALAASDGVRGQEKRRHLLQYLRDNPQELRPYAARAAFPPATRRRAMAFFAPD